MKSGLKEENKQMEILFDDEDHKAAGAIFNINDTINNDNDSHSGAILSPGKDYLLQIQKREVERTGINSLKISYNKVFGIAYF